MELGKRRLGAVSARTAMTERRRSCPHNLWPQGNCRAQGQGIDASTPARATWQPCTGDHRERILWTNSSPPAGEGFTHLQGTRERKRVLPEQYFPSTIGLPHWEGTRTESPDFGGLPFPVPFCRMERVSGRPRAPGA